MPEGKKEKIDQEEKPEAEKTTEEAEVVAVEKETEIKPEETPEQRAEREYKENIQRLEQNAKEFLKEQKLKAFQAETLAEEIKLEAPQPVLTLAQQKELDKKRGLSDAIKDNLRKASFKFHRIKNPEKLSTLIDYLEDNIIKTEREYIEVPHSEVEAKIKQYQEKGLRAEKGWLGFKEGMTSITIIKETPYKFKKADLEKLAQLSESTADPIETLERLRRFGFEVSNYDFELDAYFNELLSLVSLPEISNVLMKLEQVGLTGLHYYGFGSDSTRPALTIMRDLAKREDLEELLNPEVQQRLKLMSQKAKGKFNLIGFNGYLAISQDSQAFELFCMIAPNTDLMSNLSYLRNFRTLQGRGLIEPLLKLVRADLSLPFLSSLFFYQAAEENQAKTIISDLENFIRSPELENFFADKDFSEFVSAASGIVGVKYSLEEAELERFKKLKECPASLAGLELLRRSKFNLAGYHWQYSFDYIVDLFQDKERMEIILKTEFGEFVKTLQEKLNYQPDFNDLRWWKPPPLIEFFNNNEAKQKILSAEGAALVNYLGKFRLDKRDAYLKLLESPTSLATLKKLEEAFGYHYGQSEEVGFGGSEILVTLSQDEERQKSLFSERAQNIFKKLQQGIKYQLRVEDILTLSYYARFGFSHGVQARFFEKEDPKFFKENTEFINKAVGPYDLSGIETVPLMEQDFKSLVLKLSENLGYKYNLRRSVVIGGVEEDNEVIRMLLAKPDLQEQLFTEQRIALIKQLQKSARYFFRLQDVESLLKLPIDLTGFLKELQDHHLSYSFKIADTGYLGKFAERKKDLFTLLDGFKKQGVAYNLKIEDTENLIATIAYTPEKALEKIALVSQIIPGYEFQPNELPYLVPLIEKDYSLEALKQLSQLYSQYKSQYDAELKVALVPALVDLQENQEAIIQTAKGLGDLGMKWVQIINHAPILKNIAANNLLPTLEILKEYGNIQTSWSSIEEIKKFRDEKEEDKKLILDIAKKVKTAGVVCDIIKALPTLKAIAENNLVPTLEFLKDYGYLQSDWGKIDLLKGLRSDPDYQEIIDKFKILHSQFEQPFDFSLLSWYKKALKIDNLEQKLTDWQKDSQPIIWDQRRLKIFLACRGNGKEIKQIESLLQDEYFRRNKDAANNLGRFLQRFEQEVYPDEIFTKLMTATKDARKTKRLLMRAIGLAQVEEVMGPEQKPDYSFLADLEQFPEILAALDKKFIERASKILFAGQPQEAINAQREKIETLMNEEGFEDDFGVITNSVAIYAQKYSPRSEFHRATFNELIQALRQATELIVERDPNIYHRQKFERSQGQFNRIFEQLPQLDRKVVEEKWLDISLVIRDSLDQTSVTQKQVLKNKLNEIKTTFETEILPDLTALFKEKLANLEVLSRAGGKTAELFKTRFNTFEEYLLNDRGEIRQDIVKIYRVLTRDIKTKEGFLKSPKVEPEKKKDISKQLGTMKDLKNTLSGIYKLSTIRPERLNIKKDYSEVINDMTGLLLSSLHRLAIVDKEKKPTEGVGSNLEIDLRDHLAHLSQVISEEDHPQRLEIQTQFVTDFNSLAHCPELTGSCQRLTEVTGHNEAAYSRILDAIDELIDLWEVKISKGPKGSKVFNKQQRLARCFAELSTIKITGETAPRLTVLLDRIYTHPQYHTFSEKFAESIIKIALARFQDQKEISLLFSPVQFENYWLLIETLAPKYGYRFREVEGIEYFVNESHLKISNGKYYDAHGGLHDTTKSYYDPMGKGYLLEKRPEKEAAN